MTIHDEDTLKDVVKQFREEFPYLSITFYEGQQQVGEGSVPIKRLDSRKTIGDLRTRKGEGDVEIDGEQKIRTVERNIYLKYGFNVQIFRKVGDLWLQMSATSNRTLADVNERCSAAANEG